MLADIVEKAERTAGGEQQKQDRVNFASRQRCEKYYASGTKRK